MKIAVLAANGKSGKLITKEAIERGLDVTAIVRKENKTEAEKTILKAVDDILEAKFEINPKIVDKTNVSCNYCKYNSFIS